MTVKDVNSGSRSNLGNNQQNSRANNTQRPKNIQQWSVVDVQKWFRRHCGDYYHLYAESFLEQEVCAVFSFPQCAKYPHLHVIRSLVGVSSA